MYLETDLDAEFAKNYKRKETPAPVTANVFDGSKWIARIPTCVNCKQVEENESHLKLCSRCKLVYYCCKECQVSHFEQHKVQCKAIKRATDSVDYEEKSLKHPIDLFETATGEFYYHFGVQYILARHDLLKKIHEMAQQMESRYLWEINLHHHSEMMRLCTSDNAGTRFNIPYILLHLDKDDMAYGFCRFWLTMIQRSELDRRDELHRRSSRGDWLFPYEEYCRYDDIMLCVNDEANKECICIRLLVAMCLIKMRLISVHINRKKAAEIGKHTYPGNNTINIEQEEQVIKEQGIILSRLMERIHKENPSMLPALINPGPLMKQKDPDGYSRGSTAEAYLVARNALRLIERIPGALETLQHQFGSSPVYPHTIDTEYYGTYGIHNCLEFDEG
jgi:hypothetical protein